MPALYQLTSELQNLYEYPEDAFDQETGELLPDFCTALACKEQEFQEKALSVATFCRLNDQEVSKIDEEIKRLQAIKARREQVGEKVKDYLAFSCQQVGIEKLQCPSASISFRKSVKTIVDDETQIPKEYMKEVITVKPDIATMKKILVADPTKVIPGVHLEEFKNIQIK